MKTTLARFAHIEASVEDPVLSVYLNIDQSNATNLNRGFEVPLKNMLRELGTSAGAQGQGEQFHADADPVRGFVSSYSPRAGGKTLAVFSNASTGLFETQSLGVSLESAARWKPWPHLRPLAEALTRHAPCGVILVDREKARLWVFQLGDIIAEDETAARGDVHHFDASGKDKMWSQMVFQHKTDEHIYHHLKELAERASELYGREPFTRLLVAGTPQAAAEFLGLLPPPLKERTVEARNIGLDAPAHLVIRDAATRLAEAQQDDQRERIERLITAAAKNGKAVSGLSGVVDACLQARVSMLLYTGAPPCSGAEGEEAVARIRAAHEAAGKGAPSLAQDDVIDWLASQTVKQGGTAAPVTGENEARLNEAAGGIAALLR